MRSTWKRERVSVDNLHNSFYLLLIPACWNSSNKKYGILGKTETPLSTPVILLSTQLFYFSSNSISFCLFLLNLLGLCLRNSKYLGAAKHKFPKQVAFKNFFPELPKGTAVGRAFSSPGVENASIPLPRGKGQDMSLTTASMTIFVPVPSSCEGTGPCSEGERREPNVGHLNVWCVFFKKRGWTCGGRRLPTPRAAYLLLLSSEN